MKIYPTIPLKVLLVSAFLVSSCSKEQPKPQTIFQKVSWQELSGWFDDDFDGALISFKQSCTKINKQPSKKAVHTNQFFGLYGDWQNVCKALADQNNLTTTFFQKHFQPYQVKAQGEGLFTGYYSPILQGNLQKTARFTAPLYSKPKDLYTADLGDFDDKLKGFKIVARIDGKRLKPYFVRAQINESKALKPLLYLENKTDSFFLHVQGSGIVALPDKQMVKVSYAGHNGHVYKSIGRTLIHNRWMKKEDVSLQSIHTWLQNNPNKSDALLNSNPRFIFFNTSFDNLDIKGSLGVTLTAERSLAIDPQTIPLGVPLFVSTTLSNTGKSFKRLMFAHDTGAAIKGRVRGDIYFGKGEKAEQLAGAQNAKGALYVFVPQEISLKN